LLYHSCLQTTGELGEGNPPNGGGLSEGGPAAKLEVGKERETEAGKEERERAC
jgi:hypothetical protein